MPNAARPRRWLRGLEFRIAIGANSGEIACKYGNTLIRTLRKIDGRGFAKRCANNEKLSNVLHKLDEPSLTHVIEDHEAGNLEAICCG
jgi:hypothetical protein